MLKKFLKTLEMKPGTVTKLCSPFSKCKNATHQACIDQNYACEKSRNHVRGKFCKKNGNCGYCSSVKFSKRVLNHWLKYTKCSKRCEVCYMLRDPNVKKLNLKKVPSYMILSAMHTLLVESYPGLEIRNKSGLEKI